MVALTFQGTVGPWIPRVEILGVFGSGKTTLALALADDKREFLAEDHSSNPFWADPAATYRVGHLAYDLFFLLQHAYLASKSVSSRKDGISICDWSFASDRLWASMRLESDIPAYEAVYHQLVSRLRPPIGYLYLRHSPEVILARLRQRGRKSEEAFEADLHDAVQRLDKLALSLPSRNTLVVEEQLSANDFHRLAEQWRSATRHG